MMRMISNRDTDYHPVARNIETQQSTETTNREEDGIQYMSGFFDFVGQPGLFPSLTNCVSAVHTVILKNYNQLIKSIINDTGIPFDILNGDDGIMKKMQSNNVLYTVLPRCPEFALENDFIQCCRIGPYVCVALRKNWSDWQQLLSQYTVIRDITMSEIEDMQRMLERVASRIETVSIKRKRMAAYYDLSSLQNKRDIVGKINFEPIHNGIGPNGQSYTPDYTKYKVFFIHAKEDIGGTATNCIGKISLKKRISNHKLKQVLKKNGVVDFYFDTVMLDVLEKCIGRKTIRSSLSRARIFGVCLSRRAVCISTIRSDSLERYLTSRGLKTGDDGAGSSGDEGDGIDCKQRGDTIDREKKIDIDNTVIRANPLFYLFSRHAWQKLSRTRVSAIEIYSNINIYALSDDDNATNDTMQEGTGDARDDRKPSFKKDKKKKKPIDLGVTGSEFVSHYLDWTRPSIYTPVSVSINGKLVPN